ncbi:MAG: helicase-related protein [Candidatus Methanomethyliaceae archaeon]|nr:helicase-related protein [Candidatus Methanomethyliaceae archaeon]MDW7971201.1 helicase-related protein [Nitrososphaerota archaeon]
MANWEDYLEFLNNGPYSIKILISDLVPKERIEFNQRIRVTKINYELYPFQQRILNKIKDDTFIVGLPTGLGKTYIAGAFLLRETINDSKRILFLTPSIPLGVQQTLFARKMLNVNSAYFISGNIPPEKRRILKVWNAGFIITTPQTFYNDFLLEYESEIKLAKSLDNTLEVLKNVLNFKFPFDIVVADECHGYIGDTSGYSILLAAKAHGSKILALSATPQLHSPIRLRELKKVFENIEVISVEDVEIRSFVPKRMINIVNVNAPKELILIYNKLMNIINQYKEKIKEEYGRDHIKKYCKDHSICISFIALKLLRIRIIENGASSVTNYSIWRLRELSEIHDIYKKILNSNHKFSSVSDILEMENYDKAIIFVESVMAAKQLGLMLQEKYGIENVAILVGKGEMDMEEQASTLIHFKERAKILITTSVGEEGLDIPTADLEIWLDPPSNPKKWIQRFGRVLRQTNKDKIAKIYTIITMGTHEKRKLIGVMKKVEKIYRFTHDVKDIKKLKGGQIRLTKYM